MWNDRSGNSWTFENEVFTWRKPHQTTLGVGIAK